MDDATFSFACTGVLVTLASLGLSWLIVTLIKKCREPKRSSLNYTPRGDRVIVKQLPQQPGKQGDLLLPDSQRKPLNEGTVIAVGPAAGCSDIQVGQHVCFLDFAGSAVKIDGEDYLAMREQEIHGIR